jgi:hypothetical protein
VKVEQMKYTTVLCAAILAPSIILADTIDGAKDVLSAWEPNSIQLEENGTLRVVLPQRQITDTIYYATIQAGFCLGPIFGYEMSDVKSVFILNQNETQGWLFEGGAAACDAINNAPTETAKILVAGQSSTHTDTANGL